MALGRAKLEKSTVEALHQTMTVLREELDMKNIVIRKLRKQIRNPKPMHGCIVTIEDCNFYFRFVCNSIIIK